MIAVVPLCLIELRTAGPWGGPRSSARRPQAAGPRQTKVATWAAAAAAQPATVLTSARCLYPAAVPLGVATWSPYLRGSRHNR